MLMLTSLKLRAFIIEMECSSYGQKFQDVSNFGPTVNNKRKANFLCPNHQHTEKWKVQLRGISANHSSEKPMLYRTVPTTASWICK